MIIDRSKQTWPFICILMSLNLHLSYAQDTPNEKNALSEYSLSELMDIAEPLESTMPDSAVYVYQTAMKKAKNLDSTLIEFKCIQYTAYVYMSKGEFDSSRFYLKKAIDGFAAIGYDHGISGCWNGMANMALYEGSNIEAISHYQKALDYAKGIQNECKILVNMASLFQQAENSNKAIELLERAESIADSTVSLTSIGDINNNKGAAYLSMADHPKALSYFSIAKDQYDEAGQIELGLLARLNLASVYYLMEEYHSDLAAQLLLESEDLLKQINSIRNEAFYYKTKCGHHYRNKKYNQGIQECLKALDISNQFGEVNETASIYDHLVLIYKAQSDYKNAMHYSEKLFKIRDTLVYQDNNRQISVLETQYQTAKKDVEIKDQQLIIEKQQATRKSLLGGLGITTLFVGLIFLWSRYRQNLQRRELEIKTEKIRNYQQSQKIVALDYMMKGQQDERKRIASDLHDGLGAILSTARIQLQRIQTEIRKLEDLSIFAKADELLLNASDEVRRIAHNMMPDALMNLGLRDAIEDLSDQINQSNVLNVETKFYIRESYFSEQQEIFIYRIIQELLNNVMKHAEASKAVIELSESEDQYQLTVSDDGKGFSVPDSDHIDGVGLQSIRSRVNYLDGNIDIQSATNEGSSFYIVIPKSDKA